MLLGLVSDTHGSVPDSIHDAFRNVDYIIHAGDICNEAVLWELESIAPVIAVYGNCDFQNFSGVESEREMTLDNTKIYVAHTPSMAQKAACSKKYDLVIHGHTHQRRDDTIASTSVVNPGSASRPRDGLGNSCALVSIEDGTVGPVRFVEL